MTDAKKRVILIVDDDDGTRETYAEIFRNNGFEVIEARDGIEALDIATSRQGIDAVFTGIDMPRMDGFGLITALKENPSTSDIPTIISSHMGREDDRKKAIDLGAKDFLIRGIVLPIEAVRRVVMCLGEGKEYQLKIDPYSLDGQKLIEEQHLPDELLCSNCGANLAVKLITEANGQMKARVVCPNCSKEY